MISWKKYLLMSTVAFIPSVFFLFDEGADISSWSFICLFIGFVNDVTFLLLAVMHNSRVAEK